MKKIYISSLILLGLIIAFGTDKASAQIKIGTNGATIAPSSLLELESANQGLLLPRMADTVAINALAPPNGMLIYLTKAPAVGLYVRKVTGWEYLTGSLGGNGNFNSLTVAGTVTAGSFSGPLNGNATSANTAINATNSANSTIVNDLSTPQPTYPTFVLATNGNSQLRTATTKLSFVPNTGILTATGFAGPLTGDVTGNATSATNATNASNTDILNEVASPTIHYPTFVSGTSGNLPQLVSNPGLNFVPSTGTLTATRFSGPLTGNATSANNALTTTITNDNATGTVTYPTFVTASSGNMGQRTADARLTFVPSTGNLTATTLTSTVPTGAAPLVVASNTPVANLTSTNTLNTNVTDDVATTAPVFPTFVTATTGYQNQRTASSRLSFIPSTGALTAQSFVGPLNGNAATATFATDATNSVNSNITDDLVTAVDVYPVFVNGSPGNQPLHVGTTRLRYQPSTGRLTAGSFVGPLTGNVTGNATSSIDAQNTVNIRVTPSNLNTPFYPTFVSATSGPLPPFTSLGLSYVPQTNTLTAGTFNGALQGNASTATTVTGNVAAVNGGTGLATYNPGDIIYASTSTALLPLGIGAAGTVLRSVGGFPAWSTAGAGTVINVSGAANRITVTDPTVSPIVDIHANYAGQASINTLGTVTTGTWNGTVVDVAHGGTGVATLPAGGVLVGNGTGTVTSVSGAAGLVLTSSGPGLAPTYQAPGVGDMVLSANQTVTGIKTFGAVGNVGKLVLAGNTSGSTILNGPATGVGGTVVLPQSGVLVTENGFETLSNKTLTSPTLTNPSIGAATGTQLVLNGGTPLTTTNQTGTGSIVMSVSPVLTTPNIGAAIGSSLDVGAGTITAATFAGTATNTSNVGGLSAASVVSGATAANNATNANTAGRIVLRDASGNFQAGTITAALIGNATTATSAGTAGTATNADLVNITDDNISAAVHYPTFVTNPTSGYKGVRANSAKLTYVPSTGLLSASALSASTITSTVATGVAPFVVASTTAVPNLNIGGNAGTATVLQTSRSIYGSTFNGSADLTGPILGTFGGTGVNNGTNTLTFGVNVSHLGAFPQIIRSAGANTDVTLPASGTLYGTAAGSITSANLTNSISDETGTDAAVFANSPSLVSPRATSLVGNSATPSTALPGAGITGEAVSGTNLAGTITFTSSGAAAGGADLITVTYVGPAFPSGSYPVLYPANANAATLTGPNQVFAVGNTTSFTIRAGTTSPGGGVQYIWNYHVIGN